ncbi:MAG TPA: isoaspartyl peptidase/L-asparaginase [Polyangiaceae bacterium]|nr:isoaspartyl peptidase/L-asparaginase [Polyangiaceae bacterium]
MKGYAVALHGGAGAFSAERIPNDRMREMRCDLEIALSTAAGMLENGGSALDAVVAAVCVLEDSRVFNAARGAVLRRDGSIALDASVMCGRTRRAGAVTLLRGVQNPVRLARAVLERGEEVLLSGADAEQLARESGLALQPDSYFSTDYRVEQLERLRGRAPSDTDAAEDADEDTIPDAPQLLEDGLPGGGPHEEGQTVGAVALDRSGHLAAATSTGGKTNARAGRIGDSPIIGAGTWAHDASCAVSATGDGEYFIRSAFAHGVHARVALAGAPLGEAARQALADVEELGGGGGCVAIDRRGNIVLPFTTLAMPRASQTLSGERRVWVLEKS